MSDCGPVATADVRRFRNDNPLSVSAIPHPLGAPEYFAFCDRLREIGGPGNPKEKIYSWVEVTALLSGFGGREMFAGLLTGSMVLPGVGRFLLPGRLPCALERRFGWFLYAKAVKP